MTKSRHILPPREPWTEEEIAWLRLLYPHVKNSRLAEAFERAEHGVYAKARKLGLQKAPEYYGPLHSRLTNAGKGHRFPKGHVPANKGLRRPGYVRGRMAETQFRPGHSGTNTMPLGATRMIDGYQYTKVSAVPNVPYMVNWKASHLLLWERHRGPVPRGHVLSFLNGNHADITLANLECISRRALMARNTVHNLPAPLKEVVQLRGRLVRKIRKIERRANP